MIEKFLSMKHTLFTLAKNWTYSKSAFVDNFVLAIVGTIEHLSDDPDIQRFAYQEIIEALQQQLKDN